MKAIVNLDFGISFSSGKLVKDEILSRLPITLIMNVVSMVLVFAISLYFGIKSAFRQNSKYDTAIKNFSLISYALPSFYLALILVIIFAVELKLFPISGLYSPQKQEGVMYYVDIALAFSATYFCNGFGGVGSLIIYSEV